MCVCMCFVCVFNILLLPYIGDPNLLEKSRGELRSWNLSQPFIAFAYSKSFK